MKVDNDKTTATPERSRRQSKPDRAPAVAAGQSGSGATAAKRPDAVPPGLVNRIVYFSYALIGLAFALYNTNLVVHQMIAPKEDPAFAAAVLFFCMGMIPTVFLLFITAGIKVALIDKLGIKTIFVMGGFLVLFSLLLWGVLIESKADARAMLIGFFLPMVVRVTFQDPADTGDEAFQRILCYFSGMLLGLGVQWLLTNYASYDVQSHDETFLPFSMVLLTSQLLQLWHSSLQIVVIFRWERQPPPVPVLPSAGSR